MIIAAAAAAAAAAPPPPPPPTTTTKYHNKMGFRHLCASLHCRVFAISASTITSSVNFQREMSTQLNGTDTPSVTEKCGSEHSSSIVSPFSRMFASQIWTRRSPRPSPWEVCLRVDFTRPFPILAFLSPLPVSGCPVSHATVDAETTVPSAETPKLRTVLSIKSGAGPNNTIQLYSLSAQKFARWMVIHTKR